MHLPLPSNPWGVCSSASSIYHRLFTFLLLFLRTANLTTGQRRGSGRDQIGASHPFLVFPIPSCDMSLPTNWVRQNLDGAFASSAACMQRGKSASTTTSVYTCLSPSLLSWLVHTRCMGARPFLLHGPRLSWVTFVGKFVPKQGRGKGEGEGGKVWKSPLYTVYCSIIGLATKREIIILDRFGPKRDFFSECFIRYGMWGKEFLPKL